MKRFLALILSLALLLPCAIPTAHAAQGVLNTAIATRLGPGTHYYEPGGFLSAGKTVTVHTKVWDSVNEIWWVQVEFPGWDGMKMRAYTGSWRMSVNLSSVPEERPLCSCRVIDDADVFAGPGWAGDFVAWNDTVYAGTSATLYEVENGYGLIECWNGQKGCYWRVWAPLYTLDCGYLYSNYDDTYPSTSSSGTLIGSWRGWAIGQWCTVIGGVVNCRTGAGDHYSTADYVYRRDRLQVLDTRQDSTGKGWYQVRVGGRSLWIAAEWANVDGTADDPVINRYASPVGQKCTITDSCVSCYREPGSGSAVRDTLYAGDICQVHKVRRGSDGWDWYQVYVDDEYVWIPSYATNFGATSWAN